MTEEEAGALIADKRGWKACNGYCEQVYPPELLSDMEERGHLCAACVEEGRPRLVKCSGPGCPHMTRWDQTYEDLCYRCIRAENE